MKRTEMPISADMAMEYTRQVNRINKQLQRLEGAAKKGRRVLNYAYRGAMLDIKELFGEVTKGGKKRKRFSTALPSTVAEYQAIINAIEDFYKSPTSTLSGFSQLYAKRAATISERYNTDITASDLENIFESGLWDAISESYGSDTTMQMAIEVQDKKELIAESLDAKEQLDKYENGELSLSAEQVETLKEQAQKIEWSDDFAANFEDIENELKKKGKDFNDILREYLKGAKG